MRRRKYQPGCNVDELIQVDVDSTEIGRNRGVDVGIVGNARAVLMQSNEVHRTVVRRQTFDTWLGHLQAAEKKKRTAQAEWESSDERPTHQLRPARELNRFIDGDTEVIGDGGDVVGLAAKVLTIRKPGQWLDPGPLGCPGVGLPFGLAAELLHPAKNVMVLNGDESFGLNGMEFDTAVRFNLPIVVMVSTEGQWGEIRLPQAALVSEDRAIATQLSSGAHYDKIGQALGGHGELVESPDEIVPAL